MSDARISKEPTDGYDVDGFRVTTTWKPASKREIVGIRAVTRPNEWRSLNPMEARYRWLLRRYADSLGCSEAMAEIVIDNELGVKS